MRTINAHTPMDGVKLVKLLRGIADAVEAGDSYEGSIEYLMPEPLARELPCPRDTDGDGDCGRPACPDCGEGSWIRRMRDAEFGVRASLRVGNLNGQGGLRLIGETVERPEATDGA